MPFVDLRGRIEIVATHEAIDYIEREGKRIVHSYEIRDGVFSPTMTVEDWPIVVQFPGTAAERSES